MTNSLFLQVFPVRASPFSFDTIYAEGQRRYVEPCRRMLANFWVRWINLTWISLRDCLSDLIDQKSASRNPRSTVGTITEVYDYLDYCLLE